MADEISLEELTGGSIPNEPVKFSIGNSSMDNVKPVSASDIRPNTPPSDPTKTGLMGKYLNMIDNALEDNKERYIEDQEKIIIKYNEDLAAGIIVEDPDTRDVYLADSPEGKAVIEKINNMKKSNPLFDIDDDMVTVGTDNDIEKELLFPTEENKSIILSEEKEEDIFEDEEVDDFDEELKNIRNFSDDDDLTDEEKEEDFQKQRDEFLEEYKQAANIQAPVINLSSFTINKKPVNVTKILASNQDTSTIADWVLPATGKVFSISELSGPELIKLMPNKNRSRFNAFKDLYGTIYQHWTSVQDKKKVSLEKWLKTINFNDNDHLYFAIYKACYGSHNIVPFSCPHCQKPFVKEIDVDTMVKYPNDEYKDKISRMLNSTSFDSNDFSGYKVQVHAVSNTYAFALREPSIYSAVFEYLFLPEEFIEKYSEIIGNMSYIDEIYYIDTQAQSLTPIDTNPVVGDNPQSIVNKYKTYRKILNTLSSSEYATLTALILDIDAKSTDSMTYIYPEIQCPHCKETIPEQQTTANELLFTQSQLEQLASMSEKLK